MRFGGTGRSTAMLVHVLFFGALKDVVGQGEEHLQLAPGSDVARLFELYSERYPALARHRASLLFSRNREFVDGRARVEEGDEIAFLPPISGGAPVAAPVSEQGVSGRVICRLTR